MDLTDRILTNAREYIAVERNASEIGDRLYQLQIEFASLTRSMENAYVDNGSLCWCQLCNNADKTDVCNINGIPEVYCAGCDTSWRGDEN